MKAQSTVEFEQETRDKAIRLFTYLYELVRLRSRLIASLEEYGQILASMTSRANLSAIA